MSCFMLFSVFYKACRAYNACFTSLGAIQSEWMLDVSSPLAQKARKEKSYLHDRRSLVTA